MISCYDMYVYACFTRKQSGKISDGNAASPVFVVDCQFAVWMSPVIIKNFVLIL